MASNNQALRNNSIVVISPQYCAPYQVDLHIAKKVKKITEGRHLGVFDINGNNIFKVKSKFFSNRLILVDASRVPMVSLKRKRFTLYDRWKVYTGDSSNSKNLLFSVKRSKYIQFKIELDVFLASNKAEDVCDFKIMQNYSQKSCFIYQGNSNNNIISEICKNNNKTVQVRGKDRFLATIHPNVDCAFIIALRVIFNEISKPSSSRGYGYAGVDGGGGCGGG
ncbi:hypothetical protein MKW98_020730 [Papaver atlanticum]|uniref:Uncharacterized protein n=1 Tax=Papaver atlanticum TaxID=357466 RepID=A0AAD4XY32_9MAGN|nr:hypothetical protein MKW98_020730 [Papaver atlanticum]